MSSSINYSGATSSSHHPTRTNTSGGKNDVWGDILRKHGANPATFVPGQKSAMYPYTIEARWYGVLQEQSVRRRTTELTVEAQMLRAYTMFLEKHLEYMPFREDNKHGIAAPSAMDDSASLMMHRKSVDASAAPIGRTYPRVEVLVREIENNLLRILSQKEAIERLTHEHGDRSDGQVDASTPFQVAMQDGSTVRVAFEHISQVENKIRKLHSLIQSCTSLIEHSVNPSSNSNDALDVPLGKEDAFYPSTLWDVQLYESITDQANACHLYVQQLFNLLTSLKTVRFLAGEMTHS